MKLGPHEIIPAHWFGTLAFESRLLFALTCL
jgi:hypothetical protein